MSESTATSTTGANSRQVGGLHYKTGSAEHWDIIHDAGVPYLLGCASKYVARHREKGGRVDLEKAIHYCEKYEEKVGSLTKAQEWHVTVFDLLCWAAEANLHVRDVRILYHMLVQKAITSTSVAIRERIVECYGSERRLTEYAPLSELKPLYGPGTPEDGGHHARQPPDEEESEVIITYDNIDVIKCRLPPSLTPHWWQHRCTEAVQGCYKYDVSAARYLIKEELRHYTLNCTARD